MPTISGYLYNLNNQPIPNTKVVLARGIGSYEAQTTLTTSQGYFSFSYSESYLPLILFISSPNYWVEPVMFRSARASINLYAKPSDNFKSLANDEEDWGVIYFTTGNFGAFTLPMALSNTEQFYFPKHRPLTFIAWQEIETEWSGRAFEQVVTTDTYSPNSFEVARVSFTPSGAGSNPRLYWTYAKKGETLECVEFVDYITPADTNYPIQAPATLYFAAISGGGKTGGMPISETESVFSTKEVIPIRVKPGDNLHFRINYRDMPNYIDNETNIVPLPLNTPTKDSCNPYAYFSLSCVTGKVYEIRIITATAPDVEILVYDPSWVEYKFGYNRIIFRAPATGTYTLRIGWLALFEIIAQEIG